MEDVIKNLKDHISSLQAEIVGWKQMHADRKAECGELQKEVDKWSTRANDLVNGDMVEMIVRNKELEKNVRQLATLLAKPQMKMFLSKTEIEGIMEILTEINLKNGKENHNA